MERLTKTYSDGTHGASDSLPCGENSYDYKNLLIERLGKYEDLEEQGRLLKLPCKIGDTVWNYSCFGLRDYKVTYMGFDKNGLLYFDCESGITYSFRCYLKDFKDKIFLTKSEAEAKLELRCNND